MGGLRSRLDEYRPMLREDLQPKLAAGGQPAIRKVASVISFVEADFVDIRPGENPRTRIRQRRLRRANGRVVFERRRIDLAQRGASNKHRSEDAVGSQIAR